MFTDAQWAADLERRRARWAEQDARRAKAATEIAPTLLVIELNDVRLDPMTEGEQRRREVIWQEPGMCR